MFGVSVHIIEPGYHRTPIMNPDSAIKSIRKTWSQLSEDVKKEYGAEYMQASRYFLEDYIKFQHWENYRQNGFSRSHLVVRSCNSALYGVPFWYILDNTGKSYYIGSRREC